MNQSNSGGAGIWDSTTTNWNNAGVDQAWAADNDAVFAGTGGVVSLNEDIAANSLTFTGLNYTLSGTGRLTLGTLSSGTILTGPAGTTTDATTINNDILFAYSGQTYTIRSTTGNPGAALILNGNIDNNGSTVLISTGGGNVSNVITLNGVLSGLGGITSVSGLGNTTVLNALNTFTGQVAPVRGASFQGNTIANAGVVSSFGAATGAQATIALNNPGSGNVGVQFALGSNMSSGRPVTFVYGPGVTQISSVGIGAVDLAGGISGITGSNTSILTLGGASAAANTVSGNITQTAGGIVSLSKIAAGRWILSGNNTYTGATTISQGALSVSSINRVSGGVSSSSLGAPTTAANGTIAIGAAATSGTLVYTGIGETSDRIINLSGTTGGAAVQNDGTGALIFSSALTATGAGSKTLTLQGSNTAANTIQGAIVDNSVTNKTSLTKAGTGMWVLSGSNTYTGVTTVDGGKLKLAFSDTVPSNIIASTGTLALGGGVLNLTGHNGATNTQAFAAAQLTARTASGIQASLNGATSLSASLGGITRNAQSTLDFLLPTSGNFLTTTTSSTNGIMANGGVAYATANSGSAWATNTSGTIGALAAGVTGTANYTSTQNVDVTNGDVVSGVTVNTLRFNTASAALTLVGSNTIAAGGILVTPEAANSSITGGTIVAGATGKEVVIVNNGALAVDATIANNATASALTLSGSGVTVLSGASTYTGATAIVSGIVNVRNATGLGTTAGGASVAAGATLQLQGGITIGNEPLTIAGTGAAGQNGALVNTSGANAYGGTVTLSTDSTIASDAGSLTLTNASSVAGARNLTLTGADNGVVNGTVAIGTGMLTKAGGSTWTLKGASTYTGGTVIKEGTLKIGVSNVSTTSGALGTAASAVLLGDSTSLGTATLLIDGAFTFANRVSVASGAGSRTIGGATDGNATFSGLMTVAKDLTISQVATTGANALNITGGIAGGIDASGNAPLKTVTFAGPGNINVSGVIADGAGTVGVAISGGSMLRLTGSNSYSGLTTIHDGKLSMGSKHALAGTAEVRIGGGASLSYTGGADTFAKNITATSGTATVENAGSGVLTLSGTLTKDGTVLRLAGGAFNVTGSIVGASPNSDLLVAGTSSVTLSTANTYNGPTFVIESSTLAYGVNDAIPSNSVVTLGNATSQGTLEMNGYTGAIGGLAFGAGGGTLRLAATATSAPPLTAATGKLTLTNGTLDLAGSGMSAGLYRVLAAQSISGSFASITNANAAYQLISSATSVDYQQRAVLGAVTVNSPTAAIITGGSAAFTYAVANSALSGGASLFVTGTGLSNVIGTSGGSALAAGSTGSVSGLVFTGTGIGSQQGTFIVNAPEAFGTQVATGTVTVNVLDHATSSLAASLLTSTTISLGTYNYASNTWESGGATGLFSIFNLASSFGAINTADLSLLSVTGTGNGFTTNLGTYVDIAGGTSNQFSILFDTAGLSESTMRATTFQIAMSDKVGLSGATSTNTLSVTAQVIVVPEPSTILLAGVGAALAGWVACNRRRLSPFCKQ